MEQKPAYKYLPHVESEGGIAGDMLEIWKNNYDNYSAPKKTDHYLAKHDNEEAGDITSSTKRGRYGVLESALNYEILPYEFNGVTEQLVPFSRITDDEGLLGRTWIDTITNPKIEINNELTGRARKAVRMHELMHQKKPYADEVTVRKETQKELLTQFGTTDGTYHEARYA